SDRVLVTRAPAVDNLDPSSGIVRVVPVWLSLDDFGEDPGGDRSALTREHRFPWQTRSPVLPVCDEVIHDPINNGVGSENRFESTPLTKGLSLLGLADIIGNLRDRRVKEFLGLLSQAHMSRSGLIKDRNSCLVLDGLLRRVP